MDKQKPKVLVISGRKQAGKNTACNFVRGLVLLQVGLIDEFKVNEETLGELFVKRRRSYVNVKDIPELNVSNRLIANYEYMDEAKQTVNRLFGIPFEYLSGTNGSKENLTKYRWEDMPGLAATEYADRKGCMTVRQFLQYFGTEVCKTIYRDVHIEATYNKIKEDGAAIATINGARFPEDVLFRPDFPAEVKTIRLARTVYPEDTHSSETSLDVGNFNWNQFDAVVWNQSMTIEHTCASVLSWMKIWGWVR